MGREAHDNTIPLPNSGRIMAKIPRGAMVGYSGKDNGNYYSILGLYWDHGRMDTTAMVV